MTRVSLKEAYDNKDIVAQIYAIRDTAESAVDTSEQAVTVANGARQHVDALVPQVEQAVVNANTASASAQTSAQTVAGYENRLTVAEGAIDELESDVGTVEDNLNAVTLRVTTAEGNIVTIQGRVTALETADGQNVKLTGEHAIGDYAVLLTGNQLNIAGDKHFANPIYHKSNIPLNSDGMYREGFTEYVEGVDNEIVGAVKYSNGYKTARRNDFVFNRIGDVNYRATLRLEIDATGVVKLIMLKDIDGTEIQTVIATM